MFKKAIFYLLLSASSVIIVLAVLLRYTKLPNEQMNGFSRKWLTRTLVQLKAREYLQPIQKICGATPNNIYFSVLNPKWLIMMDTGLSRQDTVGYGIPDSLDLKLAGDINVDSPWAYFFANNIPALVWGNLHKKESYALKLSTNVFTRSTKLSSNSIVVRALDSSINTQLFQKINLKNGRVINQAAIIEKQGPGGFDSDGILKYDSNTHNLFFIEYNRNNFYCIDTNLNVKYVGHTIDTNSNNKTIIQHLTLDGEEQFIPSKSRFAITKDICFTNEYLLIASSLKADNENMDEFKKNDVIDIYNINNGIYKGSFYIPRPDSEKLKSLLIINNLLVVLYMNKIITFRIEINLPRSE